MTRKATRHHSHWRIDCDYRRKLGAADRAYLEQFEDEFYRASFPETPLHGAVARGTVYAAQNAAARDIVTVSAAELAALAERGALPPAHAVRTYVEGDYAMLHEGGGERAARDLEDALIDAIDRAPRQKKLSGNAG